MTKGGAGSGRLSRAPDERPYLVGFGGTGIDHFDWYGEQEDGQIDPKEVEQSRRPFRQWMAMLRNPALRHTPLRPEDLPVQRILLRRSFKSLSDRLNGFGSSTPDRWIVSQRYRDVIEELEPDRHWFFPYQLLCRDRTPWPMPYYLFVTVQSCQALIVEQSPGLIWEPLELRHSGITRRPVSIDGRISTKTLDRDAIAGLHSWLETGYPSWLFFSPELVGRLRKAKLRSFTYTAREENRINIEERRYAAPAIFNHLGASG